MESERLSFHKGVRDSLPICLGYLSVSFAFGLLCTQGGLPVWTALLISLTNLAGSGQFAGTTLILAGGPYLEIAVTTFVINIRYMLMSLSLSQRVDAGLSSLQRWLMGFGVTDEIFAVAMQQKGPITARYFGGLFMLPYLGWGLGTLLGAAATGFLPESLRNALGIAIYGMFLALILPAARKTKPIALVVVFSAAISCVLRWALPMLSGGWVIIICAVLVSAWAALRYPVHEHGEGAV